MKDGTCPKICVYCKKESIHHQCRFQKQFPVNSTRNKGKLQTSLVAIGEQIMMQTALAEVSNLSDETTKRVRLLLDYGSQRSYISQNLARKLKLKEIGTNLLPI